MDRDNYEQSADGPIEIVTDSGSIMNCYAITEKDGVGVAEGEMPIYGDSYVMRDVTNNAFWAIRVGKKIEDVVIVGSFKKSEDGYPFGIGLEFEDKVQVLFEYLNEQEWPDMIRVTESYNHQEWHSVVIVP